MDQKIDQAPPMSVTLLRLGIQHCLALADEAGLTTTGIRLNQALESLGGPLPGADDQPS